MASSTYPNLSLNTANNNTVDTNALVGTITNAISSASISSTGSGSTVNFTNSSVNFTGATVTGLSSGGGGTSTSTVDQSGTSNYVKTPNLSTTGSGSTVDFTNSTVTLTGATITGLTTATPIFNNAFSYGPAINNGYNRVYVTEQVIVGIYNSNASGNTGKITGLDVTANVRWWCEIDFLASSTNQWLRYKFNVYRGGSAAWFVENPSSYRSSSTVLPTISITTDTTNGIITFVRTANTSSDGNLIMWIRAQYQSNGGSNTPIVISA